MQSIHFHNNTINFNELWYQSHKDLLEKVVIELGQMDKLEHLKTKLLGEPLKIKKRVDPNKPKRPKTSFIYFCNDNRDKVKKKHPTLKLGEVMKKLGTMWKALKPEKRKKYEDLYSKDKTRYEEELDEYESKH